MKILFTFLAEKKSVMDQQEVYLLNFYQQIIVISSQNNIQKYRTNLAGEVFDMLFTLTDFLAFKEMFVSYKVSKQESTSLSLQEILSVTSLGNSPPPTSVSDQA